MPRARHHVEVPDVDKKIRAKIVDLFLNHDVTRAALMERFGCSLTTINTILREAGAIQ